MWCKRYKSAQIGVHEYPIIYKLRTVGKFDLLPNIDSTHKNSLTKPEGQGGCLVDFGGRRRFRQKAIYKADAELASTRHENHPWGPILSLSFQITSS